MRRHLYPKAGALGKKKIRAGPSIQSPPEGPESDQPKM
jgi:hypothetical protein